MTAIDGGCDGPDLSGQIDCDYGTPFVETEALLASMNDHSGDVEDLLATMSDHELDAFYQQLHTLAAWVWQRQKRRGTPYAISAGFRPPAGEGS